MSIIINKVSISIVYDRQGVTKKNPKTLGTISIYIYANKNDKWVFSTGIRVPKQAFRDKFGEWVKSSVEDAQDLNKKLENLYLKIKEVVRNCDNNNQLFSTEIIKKMINNAPSTNENEGTTANTESIKLPKPKRKGKLQQLSENTCFIVFMEQELRTAKHLASNTIKQIRKVINDLKTHFKTIPFSTINYTLTKEYDRYLDGTGISMNTKAKYMKKFLQYVNEAYKMNFISAENYNNTKLYKIKEEEPNRISLSKAEVARIEALTFENKADEKVKDIFLFAVYTGLRDSDIRSLQKSDIVKENDITYISKNAVKTGELFIVPISHLFEGKATAILEKYHQDSDIYCFNVSSNQHLNRRLKELAIQANLPKEKQDLLSMHKARHTFATICQNNGVNTRILQKMLGHTKLATTEIYSKVNLTGILNDISKVSF